MKDNSYQNISFLDTIDLVRKKLDQHNPFNWEHDGSLKSSAVMILLLNKNNTPHLLFTKRTDLVEHHKGQVSFPGGVYDPSDESLLFTAERETYEEIGIRPDDIHVLGELDDFLTVTGFAISPFVGYLDTLPQYKINRTEVAEVLEVPLSFFLNDKFFEVKEWEHKGKIYDVYFYYYQNDIIWGATAFILNRFIELIFDYNPAPQSVIRDPRVLNHLREKKHPKKEK